MRTVKRETPEEEAITSANYLQQFDSFQKTTRYIPDFLLFWHQNELSTTIRLSRHTHKT